MGISFKGPRVRGLTRGFITIALRAHRGGEPSGRRLAGAVSWSPEGDLNKAPGESANPGPTQAPPPDPAPRRPPAARGSGLRRWAAPADGGRPGNLRLADVPSPRRSAGR